MSENGDSKHASQSLTYEALGFLANHPLAGEQDEPEHLATYANELTTNIIKDASKTANDETNELNSSFPQTSKQIPSENTTTSLDKSEYSTTNGIHNDNEFDNDDIQNKMNGVINNIRSRPVTPANDTTTISRKSVTSNHLTDNSTPVITDNNNTTEGPLRSMSESALNDQPISTEQSIPIRQDENSSDGDDLYGIQSKPTNITAPSDDSIDQLQQGIPSNQTNSPFDDDEFFNTKTATIDDDQQSSNAIKKTGLDETARFGTTSPRVQSAASKQSLRVTPDEQSTSGDEKRAQMSPSKLPDDTGNDTDRDNQEVAIVARRPSRAESPFNRPRSPTPNDSRTVSNNIEPSSTFTNEQAQSPTYDDNSQIADEQKQNFESPVILRRESLSKTDQTSRPTSAIKTKFDDNSSEPAASRPSSSHTTKFLTTDEQLKLVKPGEQLQIPTNDVDNERLNSPPPGIQSVVAINPLEGSSLVQSDQDQPASEIHRQSPTASTISNEKVIDGDVVPSKSRRESNISQQQTNLTDQKPISQHGSQVIEQTPQVSSSPRQSNSKQQEESDAFQEQQTESRRTSNAPQEPISHRESAVPEQESSSRRESNIDEQKVSSQRESIADEQKPPSKRESTASVQHISSRRESAAVELKPSDRRESTTVEQKPPSRRESTSVEQEPSDRRESTPNEQKVPSRRESTSVEQEPSDRRESSGVEQKPPSRKESTAVEQDPSDRRESTTVEQRPPSRRESISTDQKPFDRRESPAVEQKLPSRRESTSVEQKPVDRRESSAVEQKIPSRRESTAIEQEPSDRRESTVVEQKLPSRKESTASEQKLPSRRESTAMEQKPFDRTESTAVEQKSSSRRESTTVEPKSSSRRESITMEPQVQSKRESFVPEQQISSQRGSVTDERKTPSQRGSTAVEQESTSKRTSLAPDQQSSDRRESSSDQQEQKSSSKPVSRKTSLAEQQQQQQLASSRENQRTSTNGDNDSSSPRRSNVANVPSSHEASRRNSYVMPIEEIPKNPSRRTSSSKQEHQFDSTRKEVLSSDADVPIRTSAKPKQERTSSIDKRQKSSSTVDDNNKRRSSVQRHSGQQSKRHSNLITDEIVVAPIIMSSSQARRQSVKRGSTTDSDYEHITKSKLPPVNSSFQQDKPRRSGTLNKQQIPISDRSEIKQVSSSHATSPSDDGRLSHWTTKIPVPSIHLSDDEALTPRADQQRPQSPNVEQIAERNQPSSAEKKRDGQKLKGQQRSSRRSTSADSANHIRLVDDKSLDSASESATDFDRHKRRHTKPKKKDVQTNTDRMYNSQQVEDNSNIGNHHHQQQRNFFDEQELTSQKPLKATKPMSDHLYSTRRRVTNKEQILTTPDTIPDTDTPVVRRSVKQSKDSNQDKDPVNVNVTVVIKKVAGTNNDGSSRTTTEAYIEQRPQQYFEPVQHPPAILPPPTAENEEKSEEPVERPKSTEQQIIQPSEQIVDAHDRHTQSDTEQIITEKQKQRRRPKRISRTCQTYECVFRRMEREHYQDLRTTSDTEKNIQTRRSQLRIRKKSPKKNLPVYLSADSFRVEELSAKQYNQSRRNISKSSAIARSLSPQGGKLLILRPTLPFHHTDAVNVQRVCLQYAIDLIPNDNLSHGTMPAHRNRLTVLKQPEHTNSLPMISGSSSAVTAPTNKTNIKEKSASNKSEEYTHQRKHGGAV